MTFLDGLLRNYFLADAAFKQMFLNDLVTNHLRDQDEYDASSQEYIEHMKSIGLIAVA